MFDCYEDTECTTSTLKKRLLLPPEISGITKWFAYGRIKFKMKPEEVMRSFRDTEVAAFYLMMRAFKLDHNDFLTKMSLVAPVARALRISDEQATEIMHYLHDDPDIDALSTIVSQHIETMHVPEPSVDAFSKLLLPNFEYSSLEPNATAIQRQHVEIPGWRKLDLRYFENLSGTRDNGMARFLRILTNRKFNRSRKSEITVGFLKEIRRELIRDLKQILFSTKGK